MIAGKEENMKGTRPLDNDEIRRVSTCFTGTFAIRNRGLFMLGVNSDQRGHIYDHEDEVEIIG